MKILSYITDYMNKAKQNKKLLEENKRLQNEVTNFKTALSESQARYRALVTERDKLLYLNSQLQKTNVQTLVEKSHQNSVHHGFWATDSNFGEKIALIHSELSEALEHHRNDKRVDEVWEDYNGKPDGVPIELADAVIRIMDICGFYNIDLAHVIQQKMDYNATRPAKHGRLY